MRKVLGLAVVAMIALCIIANTVQAKQRIEVGPYPYLFNWSESTLPDSEPRVLYFGPGGTDFQSGWYNYWRYWYQYGSGEAGQLYSGFGMAATIYNGASVQITFNGVAVDIVGTEHSNNYDLIPIIDGITYDKQDCYWNPPTLQVARPVTKNGVRVVLPNGNHTLTIVTTNNVVPWPSRPAPVYGRIDAVDVYHSADLATGYTDAQAVAAMGAKTDSNPMNHDRYTDEEAVDAMGLEANSNPLNHARYTNAEAVAAIESALGMSLSDLADWVEKVEAALSAPGASGISRYGK